jgi:NAD(P)-dependent dehydrogenase (short-subunit alcohol dehydrogenase family)
VLTWCEVANAAPANIPTRNEAYSPSLPSWSDCLPNVRGLLLTVQKALSLIRDGGSIIVISSIAAFKGIPGYTAYSATKASVRSFVRTWTAELKDRGIRVNAISPGPVDTPIIDSQAATKEGADAIRADFIRAVPLNRLGNPEEIAAAALFLASDESRY